MINFQERNDELLKLWREQSQIDGYTKFCEDGLMYKGEIKTTIADGKTYYYRDPGNEDVMWGCAPKRVLFLNKDVPNEEDEDLRARIFRQNTTSITSLFYKNISLWFYGLLNTDVNDLSPDFDSINFPEVFTPFIDKTPIAYVNCKKESGYSSISNGVLNEHINRYENFLAEQIRILDPDIIVCGGGQSSIKDFVIRCVYPKMQLINSWMYYDVELKKLIVDSFHPSYFGLTQKEMYSRMMSNYKDFLDKHRIFMMPSR